MKKNEPQKRLGRGLENLINAGLQKPSPPSVQIDKVRIEKMGDAQNKAAKDESVAPEKSPIVPQNNNVTPFTPPIVSPTSQKKDLVKDLNDLLKKTQEEAGGDTLKFASDMAVPAPTAKTPEAKKSPSSAPAEGQGVFMLLSVKHIRTSPFQRRKEFPAEAQRELAESIRSEGLMQPIVVRMSPEGGYELIAGERRLRACESIGMEAIPARVVSVQDASAAVMGLIENLQREDLNPVDEARGYGMLLTDFHMTQEQIAERVGKARATVANSLRLLMLEPEILGYVAKGQLSLGHAKVLLGLQEGAQRVLLARTAIEKALSVRQMEGLMRKSGDIAAGAGMKTKRLASEEELAVINDLQKRMVARLNAKVSINHGAKGGRVVLYYKSNAELEGILKRMGV
jgi:ParB family chromosome partitioning protein